MGKQLPTGSNGAVKTDDLIVITGAGGFIAGALTKYFHDKGFGGSAVARTRSGKGSASTSIPDF